MTKVSVHSKALNSSIEIERIIGHVKGFRKGPTAIFMGGVHGNEPAGVFGLQRVLSELDPSNVSGNIYGVAGNLWALKHGKRYQKEDLNRLWTQERMSSLHKTDKEVIHQDEAEQIEINNIIQDILSKEKGPFYFFDIHTTSSETLPFLTVNDSLLNRNYTVQYPLPIILGIEEYLDGPILSYINELGYVAFGFEAGQHDDMAAIENAISFIYLSLVFTECIKEGATNFHKHHDLLAKTTGDHRHFYEIFFRYGIKKNETFEMLKGFYNFQRVKKNQPIAKSNGSLVRAKYNGRIFMPLYQSKGSDGFFVIKKIWNPFLTISSYIRKHRLDRFLTMLPGVSWLDEKKSGLIINEKIVRFFAKEVFHLFGYRQVYLNENHLKMLNREAAARFVEYKNEKWMNS